MQFRSFLFLLFILTLCTCHKDSVEEVEINRTRTALQPSNNTYEGTILGYVFDEEKQPIADAIVRYQDQEILTDEYGIYRLNTPLLDKTGTFIRIEKQGYLFGSDLIYPTDEINKSYIQLLKIRNTRNFNSTSGGKIDIDQGGSITFDPSSIVSENGSAYAGDVYVTAIRLATNDPDLDYKMPGALIGRNTAGERQALATLGMVAVELQDATGNKLNLAPGAKAEIVFPVLPEDQSVAPATIPLWYFDEVEGIWIEEGEAILVGTDYIGSVSHFSYWNCDDPFDLVEFCVRVVYPNGLPVAGVKVTIKTEGLGCGSGFTDNKGQTCGLIPKNIPLQICFLDPICETILYTADIGPFIENVELDDIVLDGSAQGNHSNISISGQVNCDGEINENTIIVINNLNFPVLSTPDENGNFIIEFPASNCPILGDATIFAYDSETMTGSGIQNINLSNGDITGIELNLCETACGLEVEFTLGEYETCGPDFPDLSVEISGGTPPYLVQWSTGGVGSVHDFIDTGTYMVTVTDATNFCSKIATYEAEVFIDIVQANLETEMSCEPQSGAMRLSVVSGVPPYEYFIEGPNGFISTESINTDLEKGDYVFTITDALSCQFLGTVLIDGGTKPEIAFETNCEDNELLIEFDESNIGYSVEVTNGNSTTTMIIQSNPATIPWDVLSRGYEFTIIATNLEDGCITEQYYDLNPFDGLTIAAQQAPSCQDCEDGYIQANWDATANCENCTADRIVIYEHEGEFNNLTDVTTENENQSLSKGQYLVALYSTDDCIIQFENIEL